MASITNRPTKIMIDGLEYPGFISFTGNDSSVGETGLVQFQGTIEIGHHPGNPQALNPRQNRFWCFGRRVEILIMDTTKTWVLHPRGGVWIYKAFYDFQSRVLNLETGCLIYILKNRSTSDFEDPEDLVEVTEEKINPSTNEAITVQKEKYWWEQWNKPGIADIEDIVSEVLRQLDLQKVGRARGKIRTPWQPSGSLLQACGELVFKSVAPSYLWCDRDGKIRIERCYARQNRSNVIYPSGTDAGVEVEVLPAYEDSSDLEIIIGGDRGDEINYKPYDPGEEPIKELVILGTWKESPEVAPLEGGKYFKCFPYVEYGPESLVFPNGDPLTEVDIARGERCEYFYRGKKVIFEWREEKRRLVFPDTRWKFDQWVRMLEKETVLEFDPLNEDRLYLETETTKEPIGKVFNAWFQNHPERNIAGIENATTIYTDALTHDKGLTIGEKKVTTYAYHDDLSLREQKTIIYEPQAKVLETYPLFSEALQVVSEDIEKWEGHGNNFSHWKIEKICWERYNPESVRKLEKNLAKTSSGTTIAAGFSRDGHFEESNTLTTKTVTFTTPNLTPSQRLALVVKRIPQNISGENLANAPATEYYAENNLEENLIDTGGFVQKRWRDAAFCDYEPPREVIDLGEVFSEDVLEAVGDVIYFLRQGRSQMMEVELPIPEYLINNYKPLLKASVVEPTGEVVNFLVDGVVFDVGGDRCVMSFDGLWLGSTGAARPITGVEGQWIGL